MSAEKNRPEEQSDSNKDFKLVGSTPKERKLVGELQEALDHYFTVQRELFPSLRPWVRSAHVIRFLRRLFMRKNSTPKVLVSNLAKQEMVEVRRWAIDRCDRVLLTIEQVIEDYLILHVNRPNTELLHVRDRIKNFRKEMPTIESPLFFGGIKYLITGFFSTLVIALTVSQSIGIPIELTIQAMLLFGALPIAIALSSFILYKLIFDVPWYLHQVKKRKIHEEQILLKRLQPFIDSLNSKLI